MGQEQPSTEPSRPDQPQGRDRSRARLFWAAGVLAVLLIAAGGFFVMNRSGSEREFSARSTTTFSGSVEDLLPDSLGGEPHDFVDTDGTYEECSNASDAARTEYGGSVEVALCLFSDAAGARAGFQEALDESERFGIQAAVRRDLFSTSGDVVGEVAQLAEVHQIYWYNGRLLGRIGFPAYKGSRERALEAFNSLSF